MKNNNTESKLRKAANQDMVDPPAFVWDNIEKQLPSKKSNNRIIFWWFGTGLMALISIVYFVNIDTENINLSTNNLFTSTIKEDNKSSIAKTTSQEISTTNFEKNIESKSIKNQNNIDDPSQQNIVYNQSSISNNKSHNIGNYIAKKQASKIKNYDQSNNIEQIITETNNKNSDSISQIKQTQKQEQNNTDRISISSLLMSTLSLEALNFDRPELPHQDCPKFDKKFEFSSFVEFGILGGLHNLSITPNQNLTLYNLRKETESSWYSVGLYGHYGLNISKQWHVSIGAEWTMSKDRFEKRTDGITKMIVTYNPTDGSAIDTSFVSGSLISKGDLTYHFIDIPFNLGYTISKNKWNYGIELSALLNISTIAEGKMYNKNEGITSIEDQDDIYKSSVGVGYKTSFYIARKLNENTSVHFKPSFKSYIGNITTDHYDLATKYRLFSVSLGIKREF